LHASVHFKSEENRRAATNDQNNGCQPRCGIDGGACPANCGIAVLFSAATQIMLPIKWIYILMYADLPGALR